jgi:hypothetical protein
MRALLFASLVLMDIFTQLSPRCARENSYNLAKQLSIIGSFPP